jgi:hypothetical protein
MPRNEDFVALVQRVDALVAEVAALRQIVAPATTTWIWWSPAELQWLEAEHRRAIHRNASLGEVRRATDKLLAGFRAEFGDSHSDRAIRQRISRMSRDPVRYMTGTATSG